MKKSWKTTSVGVIAIVVLLGQCLIAELDGDPATQAAWSALLAACITGVGLMFARDNDRTSEDVGAKPASLKSWSLFLIGGLLICLGGCASQGEQPARAINVQGTYAEHLIIEVPEGGSVALFDRFGDGGSGDQDITLQPSAEGSATNTPTVDAQIPVNLTPSLGN